MAQSKIETGKIFNRDGSVIIANRDVKQNITHIHQRALSAIEEADLARGFENRLLAESINRYSEQLQNQASINQDLATPYRGLLPYRIADSEVFWGRGGAISELLETLERGKLAILHAESGSGKTSLLEAGVVPHILIEKHLPIILRPYDISPSQALKELLLSDPSQTPMLAAAPLRDILFKIIRILGDDIRLFIIVDQFEEFFDRVPEKKRSEFTNELGKCLDDTSLNVHWLFALRGEAFSKLSEFRPRIRNPFENECALRIFSRAEAESIIKSSAQKFNLSFEDGLIQQLLDDLGKDQIVPPQLQLVCSALAKNLSEGQTVFTNAAYQQAGAVKGILAEYLSRVIKQYKPAERVIVRKILEALISSIPKRILRPYADLCKDLERFGINQDELDLILTKLTDDHLLRVSETDAGLNYELVHDYLLGEIQLDPEVKKRKQAEELLEQGLDNWHNQNILLGLDALQIIDIHRENIYITDSVASLMFLSTLYCGKEDRFWINFISETNRQTIIHKYADVAQNPRSQNKVFARTALSKLHKNLPPDLKKEALIWRAQKFGAKSLKFVFILSGLLIGGGILILMAIILSSFVSPFSRISSWESACLEGERTINPLVAVDTTNPAHMAIYDPAKQILCQTYDTAYSWEKISVLPPSTNTLKQLVISKKIYIVTNIGAYVEKNGQWLPLTINNIQGRIYVLAVNPNNLEELFVWTDKNVIGISTDEGKSWSELQLPIDQFNQEPIIELSTNGVDLIASSTKNIWFYSIPKRSWEYFDLKQSDAKTIQDVEIIGPTDAIYVLADGTLYSGNLHDRKGVDLALDLATGVTWPPHITSLSAYKTATLIGSSDGVYCSQSWNIFNLAWWRWKIDYHKPCR